MLNDIATIAFGFLLLAASLYFYFQL